MAQEDISDLEKMKEKFFIDGKEFDKKKLNSYIDEIIKFAKIDRNGNVHFLKQNITNKDKVLILALARFLANQLEAGIPNIIDTDTVVNMCLIEPKQANARLLDLSNEKLLSKTDRGKYEFLAYRTEDVIDLLKMRYGDEK